MAQKCTVPPFPPAPPDSVAYYQKVRSWPMYYDDQYGDCTCAAAGRMIQNWTASAATEISPTWRSCSPPEDGGKDVPVFEVDSTERFFARHLAGQA